MTTSSGRGNEQCERCGHMLNEHARKSESKCKKCTKYLEICQQIHLGGSGYRLCYIPCRCGEQNYPDKAKAAKPLEPYEYLPSHPGYRPREHSDEDEESKLDISLDSSPIQASASQKSPGASMHTRNVSQESEDPLQWSEAKYMQNTTMPDLIKTFAASSIGAAAPAAAKDKGPEDTSQWCDWEWHEEYHCEYRMRQKDGRWEYEYRKSPSLVSAAPIPTTKKSTKSSKSSEPSKSSESSKSSVPSKLLETSKSSSKSLKSKSKSSKAKNWSEWEWHEEYKREYRSRQKEDGTWEYEYKPNEG